MYEWFKEKIKNISSIIDLSILISIITCMITVSIYTYKWLYLKLLGVPLQMIYDFIDIKFIDYISAIAVGVVLMIIFALSYLTLYKAKWMMKILILILLPVILLVLIKTLLKMGIMNSNDTQYWIFIGLALYSTYVFGAFVVYGLNNSASDIIDRIFKRDNEKVKLVIFISETLRKVSIFILIALVSANISVIIPRKRVLIDDKLLLFTSSSNYLVVDFETVGDISNQQLIIDKKSFYIISKEVEIKKTEVRSLVK